MCFQYLFPKQKCEITAYPSSFNPAPSWGQNLWDNCQSMQYIYIQSTDSAAKKMLALTDEGKLVNMVNVGTLDLSFCHHRACTAVVSVRWSHANLTQESDFEWNWKVSSSLPMSVNFYHFLQSQCWILDMLSCFVCLDLLSPCESIPTNALSCCFIAGSSGCTLAPLQTALPKCACWTRLFTVASIEPWRTATWSLHRVAESSVLTLALLLAVRSPVFIVTVWKVKGQTQYTESCKTLAFSNIFIYLLILFQTERVSSYIDLYRNHGIGLLRSYPSDLIWGTCNLFQPAAQLLLVIVWLNVTSAAMHALSSTGALVAALHVWP